MLAGRVLDSLVQAAFSLPCSLSAGPGASKVLTAPLLSEAPGMSLWLPASGTVQRHLLGGWMMELAAGTGQPVPAMGLGLCVG